MNKMLRKELINVLSKEKHTVSFFEDDSVQTVREQVAKSANSHPDKMFVLVNIKLPKDYYTADSRNWENLFGRLSYNGRTIEKSVFDEYQTSYRFPNTRISYTSYDLYDWMSYPSELKPLFAPVSEFSEYRIFGVPDIKSFVLPLSGESQLLSRIPAQLIPRPDTTKLLSTYYDPASVDHFSYTIHQETNEDSGIIYYFPYLRSETPNVLSDEAIRILDKNSKLLTDLLDLSIPKEDKHSGVHVLHTRFYIPWVDTDFGSAVRTRFEQIFYGLTVSSDIPYIGLFTSKDEINRHKFFTEDPKTKEPFLDMTFWKTWWSLTKPARNRPTLILYRGKSKHHFDRILITSGDMIISTNRPENNTETPEELKKSCEKWLRTFDAIIPFLDEKDLHFDRWELQEMKIMVTYPNPVDSLSVLRFNCITPFYSIADKTKSSFTMLRSDHANFGVTSVEAKIIQMAQEGPLDVATVSKELSLTTEHAAGLIRDTENRREENSRLGDRLFRGYPTMVVGTNFVRISAVTETKLSVKYADILRYILSNPESPELDTICPARMQTIAAEAATINTTAIDHDAVVDESFADLFDDFDAEKEEPIVEKEEAPKTSLDVANQPKTTYSYFANRLKSFDPETFVKEADFSKRCEKLQQPIVFTPKDKKRLSEFENGKYDPINNAPEGKVIDLENPDGSLVCPEYWCMKDEIPLREDQLISEDGTLKCPVCRGKLDVTNRSDPREYPLIKKENGKNFPRPKYKSPGNGKDIHCCYMKPQTKKAEKQTEIKDKYYVFKEDKRNLPEFRMAKLDSKVNSLLFLQEDYSQLDNQRISDNTQGFFRVGLGHASENLPRMLGMTQKIPSPRESVSTVLKCSFTRMWTKPSDTHAKEISAKLTEYKDTTVRENLARIISGIDDAFENKELSPIQELEYSALALQCDLFRMNLKTHTVGCLMYSSMIKSRTRGIIILQNDTEIDILANAKHVKNTFVYNSNIFAEPFKRYAYRMMEHARDRACTTEIPNYTQARNVLNNMFGDEKYTVILDPFGRGQALYIPHKVVLPFQSMPLAESDETRIWGYSGITGLPTFDQMKPILQKAESTTKGYEFQDSIYDSFGRRVEILTTSGLRIPVKPEKVGTGEVADVIPTVSEIGESELVFGSPNKELEDKYKNISYDAEVYEFLIFQLSKDLQDDDYLDVRKALLTQPLKRKVLEPLLKKWFDRVTQFVDIKDSRDFISKIRAPCGQFSKKDCKGNLCGWDGKVCRIQIKKSVKEDKLFNRIFTAMFDNSKIRAVVLDGRSTPFFSTILYLELPHEVIITDKQLS